MIHVVFNINIGQSDINCRCAVVGEAKDSSQCLRLPILLKDYNIKKIVIKSMF